MPHLYSCLFSHNFFRGFYLVLYIVFISINICFNLLVYIIRNCQEQYVFLINLRDLSSFTELCVCVPLPFLSLLLELACVCNSEDITNIEHNSSSQLS